MKEKKSLQFSVRFEDSLIKNLNKVAKQMGLSLAEIVRLCVIKQLDQIRQDGGFNFKVSLDDK